LHLLRDFDPEPGDGQVPDPYYGGPGGFERMYVMVNRACEALLDHLEERRLDRTTSEG
jgi:protein-tyrosine phosphatase